MDAENAVILLTAVIAILAILVGYKKRDCVSESEIAALRVRLENYEKMYVTHWLSDGRAEGCPSRSRHEMLLGTLKKVEGKNAALFQGLIFLMTSVVIARYEIRDDVAIWVYPALIYLGALFIFSIFGMRQLDDRYSSCKDSVEMQIDLMKDLLYKEALYRWANRAIIAFVVAGIASLAWLASEGKLL